MVTLSQEYEFERRIYNLLRTYNTYKIIQNRLIAIQENPSTYIETEELIVPSNTAQEEIIALQRAHCTITETLKEQALTIGEPLIGNLPETPIIDISHMPQDIREVVEASCQFMDAALQVQNIPTPHADIHLYEGDDERY